MDKILFVYKNIPCIIIHISEIFKNNTDNITISFNTNVSVIIFKF